MELKPKKPDVETYQVCKDLPPGTSTAVFRRDMHLMREIIRRQRGIRAGSRMITDKIEL